ncbi:Pyrazinamidase/nicotinamidase, partial [Stegodyphus mimosarum]
MTFFNGKIDFCDSSIMLDCIKFYAKSEELCLNLEEFRALTMSVMIDSEGELYHVSTEMYANFFLTFDSNKDGKIDVKEFETVWHKWIKPLLNPVSALLIIDVQNDFINGTLALKNCPAKQDGVDVVPIINDLLENVKFDLVVYSLDCHPEKHVSFFECLNYDNLSEEYKTKEISLYDTVVFEKPPKMEQKLWPRHCVKETWGAQLHSDLKIAPDSCFIYKGVNPDVDSYSAFQDNRKLNQTALDSELKKRGVTHVFICGIALDYCVAFTAFDAIEYGYATVVIEDASRGTNNDVMEKIKQKLTSGLCVLTKVNEVDNFVKG